MGRPQEYSDKEMDDFLEVAQEIGIGKAMKELGYPKSFSTAQNWAKNRGVNVNVDPVMARAKQFDILYKEDDMLSALQSGISAWYEYVAQNAAGMEPDEHKKMAEAMQKYANTWLVLQGKANEIKGTVVTDKMDSDLMAFLNSEQSKIAERLDEESR